VPRRALPEERILIQATLNHAEHSIQHGAICNSQRSCSSAVRTPSGRARRYDLDSYIKLPGKQKHIVLYARVISRAQKPDLERQIARLVSLHSGAEGVGDIGGGLHFQRPRFLALLERIGAGDVGTLVVAYKDRLCRFGFELVAWYCRQHGFEKELRSADANVVLNHQDHSPQQEWVEDILAILHGFSHRLSGLRKYRSRKRDVVITAIQEDQDLSRTRSG